MKIIETLDWILDKNDKRINGEEEYLLNIEFVHSLGLKCDCVGWSKLDLQNPRADEILSAIDSFCKKNGWKARVIYTRTYADYASDWYEIVPTAFKDNTLCDYDDEYESEQGKKVRVFNLRAYHELRPSPKRWSLESMLVPERFRDACIRHNITDIDFCWARDKGKYQAEQYFHLYCNYQIPTIALCRDITVEDKERIEALGGHLPSIAGIFYKLQQSDFQDCYLESNIPECNIAHAYLQRIYYPMFGEPYVDCVKNKFLIHKNFALILLQEKAISQSDLMPAMVVKELPRGYTLSRTVMPDRPIASCLQHSIAEYKKLKSTERPLRLISEKDALKLLRLAKKERKEDFKKAFAKAKSVDIAETSYAPVLPYYLIANGGYLSDEYELLSYNIAIEETKSFTGELLTEELLETKPEGIVIAKCPDGDKVLLCDDGKVIRFSHEEPVATEEWLSLAQFIADAINE
ncbi:MAG: hypothetical protein IJX55_04205 [Clostridia bacterium]|nr:hypothetical protein [Clostridia bacterium]